MNLDLVLLGAADTLVRSPTGVKDSGMRQLISVVQVNFLLVKMTCEREVPVAVDQTALSASMCPNRACGRWHPPTARQGRSLLPDARIVDHEVKQRALR